MDNLNNVLVHSADKIKPFLKLADAPIGSLMREVSCFFLYLNL